jgi:hypothetical protein
MHKLQWVALPVALAAGLALVGCGTQGAPQPPSLKLPAPVTDLAASRAGNQVTLTWTMPNRNTDKLLLNGNVTVRICRKEGTTVCAAAGAELSLAPGVEGAFAETLPVALDAGPPRPLVYFVELKNRNGRSAGLSNAAPVLAGVAPEPVVGLAVEVRKQGVVLRWTPAAGQKSSTQVVRLHRRLLTPPAAKPHEGLLAPQAEPVEQNLLVEAGAHSGRALDKNIRFGQSYEYRAQRVARVTVDGKALELVGELSAPARVAALDQFPPDVPADLAAVATVGEDGAETAIDLSWQPVTDANLAGYIVYRSEAGRGGKAAWQRISPAKPLPSPSFHDAEVEPGHTYRYAISALAQNGHESARSAETEETVPIP